MGEPGGRDYAELAAKLAALEERMNTKQAEYETGLERLGKQIAERDARLAERDTRHAEEWAKRDKDNLRWQVGLWIAAIVVLGILIRWP